MQLPESEAPLLRALGSSSHATLSRLASDLVGSMPGVCEAICVSVDVVQFGGPSMRDVANDVEWRADQEAHQKLSVFQLEAESVAGLKFAEKGEKRLALLSWVDGMLEIRDQIAILLPLPLSPENRLSDTDTALHVYYKVHLSLVKWRTTPPALAASATKVFTLCLVVNRAFLFVGWRAFSHVANRAFFSNIVFFRNLFDGTLFQSLKVENFSY
ncbi:hypothetical protein PMIN01_11884 [Paraphaeosphaeria minitans]|uniref:Uncharacterized protein n=1 Tax=Paraphaeosphaeria minitans TaxID=565426 RepID=A0A9P6G6D6_9PLEO|nr:hypothetical protein PMIN01_11884 [Paraphaeosphaeria minitans]